MLIYSGCSTTAPNPEAVALKPNLLDSIDYDLPASFYGCWEGTIDSADSVTPLNWTGNHARVEHNTYQLCYRRRPESGGELVLTKFEAGGNNLDVISFDNHVTAVDDETPQPPDCEITFCSSTATTCCGFIPSMGGKTSTPMKTSR